MATTFDSVLSDFDGLISGDWNTIEALKPKAIELLKRTFPGDSEEDIKTIRSLKQPVSVSFGTPPVGGLQIWYAHFQTFKSIMLARKETYDLKKESDPTINTPLEAKNHSIAIALTSKEKKIQELADVLVLRNKEIADFEKIIFEKDKQIKIEKGKRRGYNALFWTILIGAPGLLFYVGYYFGNNRFDAEKLSMRDTIINLKAQNTALRNIPKPAKKHSN